MRPPLLVALTSVVALDSLAFAMVLPVLPARLAARGTPIALVLAIFAAFSVCQFVAAPLFGRVADRVGRRRVMVASQVGTLAGFMVLALAPTPWWLLVSRIVDGATAGNLAVVNAAVCDGWAPERRSGAFATVNAGGAAGVVAGLALAAWSAHQPLAALGWYAAAATVITILVALIAPFPARRLPYRPVRVRSVLADQPELRAPGAGIVVAQVVLGVLTVSVTLLLVRAAGVTERAALLILIAGLVIGAGLQAVLSGPAEVRLGSRRTTRAGYAAALGGGVLLGAGLLAAGHPSTGSPAIAVIVIALALLTLGTLLALSAGTAWLGLAAGNDREDVPGDVTRVGPGAGLVMGLGQSLASVGQLLGPALGLTLVSLGAPVLVGGLCVAAVAGIAVTGITVAGTRGERVRP